MTLTDLLPPGHCDLDVLHRSWWLGFVLGQTTALLIVFAAAYLALRFAARGGVR